MRSDIDALKKGQEAIQKSLEEIKTLLKQSSAGGASAPPGGAQRRPSTSTGHPFEGSPEARARRGRVLRLPVPLLRAAHPRDLSADREGLHRHRQGPLRDARLTAAQSPVRVQGRRGRDLRRRQGQVLGDAPSPVRRTRTRSIPRRCRPTPNSSGSIAPSSTRACRRGASSRSTRTCNRRPSRRQRDARRSSSAGSSDGRPVEAGGSDPRRAVVRELRAGDQQAPAAGTARRRRSTSPNGARIGAESVVTRIVRFMHQLCATKCTLPCSADALFATFIVPY